MRRHLLRLLGAGAFTVPGLGGQNPAPQNAPAGLAPVPGVQPGAPNLIRARKVVIGGTGAGTGLFIYSGIPAAGNLVGTGNALPFGASVTDPYGNAYLGGYTSYAPGSPYTAASVNGAAVNFYKATTYAGPWTVIGQIEVSGTILLLETFTGIQGIINVPQGAVSGFPISSSAALATVITDVNALYSALVSAGVIA